MSNSSDSTPRRVLALDTATRTQSMALLDGDEVLEHLQRKVRFNHGSSLLDNVSEMLHGHGLGLAQLDLIAVGQGPGSFTGLRVGMALAKSFARAHETPIVAVSSLAALAFPVARAYRRAAVCPMYDARRNEVYTAIYKKSGQTLETVTEDHSASPGDARDRILQLAETEQPVVVVGDGPRKYELLGELHAPDLNWETPEISVMEEWADGPSGVGVALLGRHRARKAGPDDLDSLEPNYIRPTDAEMNLAEEEDEST